MHFSFGPYLHRGTLQSCLECAVKCLTQCNDPPGQSFLLKRHAVEALLGVCALKHRRYGSAGLILTEGVLV